MGLPKSLRREALPPEPGTRLPRWLSRLVSPAPTVAARARRTVALAFVVPLVATTLLALPIFPTKVVGVDMMTFLVTLWQVHGGVTGLAMVVFVFLLQTVNVSRRSTTLVLALARESWILAACSFGMSTICGIGLCLAEMVLAKAQTVPLVLLVCLAAAANVVLVLLALVRSLGFLGNRRVTEMQERLLLEQVERTTLAEIAPRGSMNWLAQELEDTPVGTLYGRLEGSAWTLDAPGGRVLWDVDLEKIDKAARRAGGEGKRVLVEAFLGNAPERGRPVLKTDLPRDAFEKELRKALKWRRPIPVDEDVLLDDAAEEFFASVRDGDIGRFREGMDRCAAITRRCLETLGRIGLKGAAGAEDLPPIDKVRMMLRFGLEEALKTRRSDFVLEVRDSLRDVAMAAYEHANRTTFELALAFYPFLRTTIVSLGLQKDELYQDVYWRPLREMALSADYRKKEEPDDFAAVAIEAIKGAYTTMVRDSIRQGAPDLDELFKAWSLTFGEWDSPRARRGQDEAAVTTTWLDLGAWAVYQAESGTLDAALLRDVLRRLANQVPDVEDVVGAMVRALSAEDSNKSEVERWIMFSMPESLQARILDARGPIVAAGLAMSLLRWGSAAGAAEEIADADKASRDVEETVRGLGQEGGRYRTLFDGMGLLSPDFLEGLDKVSASFVRAREEAEERKRAELRGAAIDSARADRFVADVKQKYLSTSLFRALPSVFTVEGGAPAESDEIAVGYNELIPKEFFTPDGFDTSDLANQMATGLDRGEIEKRLNEVARAPATTRLETARDALADSLVELCEARQGGLLVVRWGTERTSLYADRRFRYDKRTGYKFEMGSLAVRVRGPRVRGSLPAAWVHDDPLQGRGPQRAAQGQRRVRRRGEGRCDRCRMGTGRQGLRAPGAGREGARAPGEVHRQGEAPLLRGGCGCRGVRLYGNPAAGRRATGCRADEA